MMARRNQASGLTVIVAGFWWLHKREGTQLRRGAKDAKRVMNFNHYVEKAPCALSGIVLAPGEGQLPFAAVAALRYPAAQM
jgi:hypothetical protein